jgi:hypothetical protein
MGTCQPYSIIPRPSQPKHKYIYSHHYKHIYIYMQMFTLPYASKDIIQTWFQKNIIGYDNFANFKIIWCGTPANTLLHKNNIKPEHVFIISNKKNKYKWVYHDKKGFSEIPDKWYSKCFLPLENSPKQNKTSVLILKKEITLPYYPDFYYRKLYANKKRKRITNTTTNNIIFPTWKNIVQPKKSLNIAQSLKSLFDKADAGEIILDDPLEGYNCIDDLLKNKVGHTVYMNIASFVYHHCRENLGYPIHL